MERELIKEARKIGMGVLMKHGVYEQRPLQECWESTGKSPA